MKKLIAMLLTATMVLGLAACGSTGTSTDASSSAAEESSAEESSDAEPAASTEAAGSVYYLNFKPEADAAWQELAALYTEKTGVPVEVVTAASGTYEDTLTAEIAKTNAPTLFQISSAQDLLDWGDYSLDLTDTDVLGEMSTTDFNLTDETGAVKAIGYCYECFGIIVNTALLEEAGYTLADITDFESLSKVANDIHDRADELGFDAFAAAGLDASSSWRFSGHLANMPLYYEFRDDKVTEQPAEITGAYLDNYRNIWDLYINASAAAPSSLSTVTADQSQAEFGTGKAVFWQQGSWEYANLVGEKYGMDPANLTMIPIYCGVEGEEEAGLCSGTENYWVVNSQASEEDIQATLDFLYWVVTSDEGTTMMAEQFGIIPFKNAKTPENVFVADANEMLNDGKYTVTWAFTHTPNTESWRATVVTALTAYSADQTDANWDAVVKACVDGWAYEYSLEHGE